jgi:hypothetical protein
MEWLMAHGSIPANQKRMRVWSVACQGFVFGNIYWADCY